VRATALVVLTGACYQPTPYAECTIKCEPTITSSCPDDYQCIQRRCRSSVTVACKTDIPDSPPGCPIPTQWAPNISFGVSAFAGRGSYTTDLTEQVAALDVLRIGNGDGEHDVKIGPDGMMLTTVVVADALPLFHLTPRLSPEGLDIFLLERRQGTASARFLAYARPDRNAIFTPTGEMVIFRDDTQQTLTQSDRPGTPTLISSVYPRRMMIKKESELWEVEQATDNPSRWDFVDALTAADVGLVAIRDQQMSADGLRLVFGGSTTGADPFFVYGATRASMRDRFDNPVLVLESEVGYPFLSADCRTLYGRGNASGQVGRRAAPR